MIISRNILTVCLLISLVLPAACARKKAATENQSCQQQIAQAEAELQTKTATLTKSQNSIISNLITAAKIHQQHKEEMLCVEKVQRAITLLAEHKSETSN